MGRKFWALLAPFHRDLSLSITGIVIRQLLLVLGGYSLVWVLRASTAHTEVSPWIFVGALALYDAGQLGLDLGLKKHLAERGSYPLFGRLRLLALCKVFRMPLEWHQG